MQLTASGQAWTSTTVRLLDLSQLVSPTVESGHKAAGSSYFESLSRRAFNGPLVGGNVSSKELLKWIDEREKLCKEEAKDSKFDDLHRKSLESLSDLWGVLKIMCQHHGKLRSTIGTTGLTLQACTSSCVSFNASTLRVRLHHACAVSDVQKSFL